MAVYAAAEAAAETEVAVAVDLDLEAAPEAKTDGAAGDAAISAAGTAVAVVELDCARKEAAATDIVVDRMEGKKSAD